MSFDVRDVGYFLRAAELLHVGRAAAALGLTQPAITKAIARLERELGLKLFERTPRGLSLTAVGSSFRVQAERIHAEYEDAMRVAGDLRAGSAGLLRVGASTVAADSYVTPALATLLKHRPSMRVSLSVRLSSDVMAALRAGQLDVVVAPSTEGRGTGLDASALDRDDLVVVAASRHPVFRRTSIGLADVAAYRWIMPREPLRARGWIDGVFRKAGIAPPVAVVEVDYGSSDALALAARTDLLTLAAYSRQRRHWAAPVRRVELPELVLRRTFSVFTRRGAYRSPILDAFVEALHNAVEPDVNGASA